MSNIDPICGMKGTIKAHGHYFCSEFCIRKYEEQHGIEKEKCYVCAVPGKKWYTEKIFLVIFGLITVLVAHLILDYLGVTFLHNLLFSFYEYVKLIWLALIIGFLLGGMIDHFIPRKYVSKYLAQHKKRTILYSVGLGFLMSACSHGILAIAIELYKKGASTPAVIAFLLASPWANLPITIILLGFFGIKALLFVGFAIIIAVVTGLIFQVLDRKGMIEPGKHIVEVEEDFSILKDIKRRWQEYHFTLGNLKNELTGILKGSWELSKMVLWWILIGMFLASAARAYVPHNFFMNYMGPNLLGLLVTLVLATVIEVCSEGTAPLAFEIFKQTNAFGNSFVFLMAGVATDYTEIGLIWSNIGKRTALWLPIITVPQIIILGYIFNNLL
ncbi:MAG: permease [Candidatus Zixiibacteriota bacterium]